MSLHVTEKEVEFVPRDATGQVFDSAETNESPVNKIISILKAAKYRDAFQIGIKLFFLYKCTKTL